MTPRGGANFDPRAKILTTFVEVYQTMFHVKYLSSSLYGLREEVFSFGCHGNQSFKQNFIFLITLKELYAINIHTKFYQNWLSGLGGEVILMKKFKDGRTDDGHQGITIAHHEHYVLTAQVS